MELPGLQVVNVGGKQRYWVPSLDYSGGDAQTGTINLGGRYGGAQQDYFTLPTIGTRANPVDGEGGPGSIALPTYAQPEAYNGGYLLPEGSTPGTADMADHTGFMSDFGNQAATIAAMAAAFPYAAGAAGGVINPALPAGWGAGAGAAPLQYASIPGAVTDAPVFDTLASNAGGESAFANFQSSIDFPIVEGGVGQFAAAAGGAAGAAGGAGSAVGTAAATGAATAGTGAVIDGSASGGDNGDIYDGATPPPEDWKPPTSAVQGGVAGAVARILDGTATTADYLAALGSLGATGLGIFGSKEQASAFRELSDKYMAIGAPSRERYDASFKPGFTMASDPGYSDALNATAKATTNALSVNGNPATSPNAWNQTLTDLYAKTAYPALQEYRRTNGLTGGYSAFNASAPGASTNAIGADGKVFDAIGSGLADITQPRFSLNDIFTSISPKRP